MKKFIITLIAATMAIAVMADGTKLWLYSHSGNHQSIDVADVDSISYTAPKSVGQAMAAGSKLWVHSHSGNHISIDIADLDSIGFTESGNAEPDDPTTVTDACGNKYKVVTIGSQVWMAENMRCNKYDTESERAGATLSTSSSITHAPYYTDASDKSLWDSNSQEYGANLTSEQIGKLGYLYNWAAAVGLATAEFSTNRQGICPNGWHIPTIAEWDALKTYIEETDGKGDDTAGKHLKTTSGWYGWYNGTDDYSFAALPAGYAIGSTVYYVGYYAYFWTATPKNINSYLDADYAYNRNLFYKFDPLYGGGYYSNKYQAQGVRCVRN